MNLYDILIILALGCALFFALRHLKKKKGCSCGCGCGCSQCSGSHTTQERNSSCQNEKEKSSGQ